MNVPEDRGYVVRRRIIAWLDKVTPGRPVTPGELSARCNITREEATAALLAMGYRVVVPKASPIRS